MKELLKTLSTTSYRVLFIFFKFFFFAMIFLFNLWFSGEVINPKDRCKKCQGKKVCKESKILEVSCLNSTYILKK